MKKHPRYKAFEVVMSGYNRLGNLYTLEREKADNWKEVNAFTSQLPANGRVLDAGSGTGIPIARHLVQAGFELVGIDFSKTMIAAARENVPDATFQQMNMTAIDFPPESFDGVISTYAIIHIPRELHAGIFRSFHSILKARGVMLVSVASWAWEEFADYMGVDMFWSHYGPDKTRSLITVAGFDIEFGRDVETGGEKHHWVLARKR
ncbi:MAG: class I SAM-dependent methyltransferase [Candidatus Zixiibacteriota bacterium]|nr:MAG: class I SAM-dependent methyltransferase [candidate division Zixibacteria bacterium]